MGGQRALENTCVHTRFGQRPRLDFSSGRVGNENCECFGYSDIFVLIAIGQPQTNGVGAGNIGTHRLGEPRVHEKHLTVGDVDIQGGGVHGGFVDTPISGHLNRVGDHIVVIGQGFVDAAANQDAVGHLHYTAALQTINGLSARVQVGDLVARTRQRKSTASQGAVLHRGCDIALCIKKCLGSAFDFPGSGAIGVVYRQHDAVRNIGRTVTRCDGVLKDDVVKVNHRAVGHAHGVFDFLSKLNRCIRIVGIIFNRHLGEHVIRIGRHGGSHVQIRRTRTSDRGVFTPGCGDQGAVKGISGQPCLVFVRCVEQSVRLKLADRKTGSTVGHRTGQRIATTVLHLHGRAVHIQNGIGRWGHPHRAAIQIGRCHGAGHIVCTWPPTDHKLVGQVALRHQRVGPIVRGIAGGIGIDNTHSEELAAISGRKMSRRAGHQKISCFGCRIPGPSGATGRVADTAGDVP